MLAVDVERLVESTAQRGGHAQRVLASDRAFENDAELVASSACQRIDATDALAKLRRDLPQQLVAGVVAERVVDLLETVEVDGEEGHLHAVATRPLHRAAEPILEQPSVGQPGQRVMLGQVLVLAQLPLQKQQDHADRHQVLGQVPDFRVHMHLGQEHVERHAQRKDQRPGDQAERGDDEAAGAALEREPELQAAAEVDDVQREDEHQVRPARAELPDQQRSRQQAVERHPDPARRRPDVSRRGHQDRQRHQGEQARDGDHQRQRRVIERGQPDVERIDHRERAEQHVAVALAEPCVHGAGEQEGAPGERGRIDDVGSQAPGARQFGERSGEEMHFDADPAGEPQASHGRSARARNGHERVDQQRDGK